MSMPMSFETGLRGNADRPLRVGSVSYLNAKPLIWGLDEAPDLELILEVPARLLDGLRQDRFDVALLPVIDYQRMPGLRLLTSGGIGSEGRTLTVRIFSTVSIARIERLACDVESHTSVALARVILAEKYGIRPTFVDLLRKPPPSASLEPATEALLLIGDKVICEEPSGYPYQLDLGEAWRELTGLPFVFAAWMSRDGVDLRGLPTRLERAKREGLANARAIVAKHALPRGWPPGVALKYLTDNLQYDIGPRQLEAIRLFHEKAGRWGVIEGVRPLEIYDTTRPAGTVSASAPK